MEGNGGGGGADCLTPRFGTGGGGGVEDDIGFCRFIIGGMGGGVDLLLLFTDLFLDGGGGGGGPRLPTGCRSKSTVNLLISLLLTFLGSCASVLSNEILNEILILINVCS